MAKFGNHRGFTVAWQRQMNFARFEQRWQFRESAGGHVYPGLIIATDKKPIRVFLCDGRKATVAGAMVFTTRNVTGLQNVRLMKALPEGLRCELFLGMNCTGRRRNYAR